MKYKYRHREVYNDVQLDIRANTQSELIRKTNAKKKRLDKVSINPNTTLYDFGIMFLETYKRNSVSDYWYENLYHIFKKICTIGETIPVSNIKPIQIQNMLNACSNLSDSYVKKIYDLTCQLWHYTYKNGLTEYDYSEDLKRPKGRSAKQGRSLTDEERKVFLSVIEKHRGELFCKIMLYMGLRPSEVHALQWVDFDFNKMALTISKSRKNDMSIGEPKSKSGYRTVPIPEHLKSFLLSKKSGPFEYIAPKTAQWRRDMWKNIKREMNIAMGCKTFNNGLVPPLPLDEPFDIYFLRHTYCTDLEKMGVPINIASRLMGHSDISITSKIYTHASSEAFEIVRQIIDSGQNSGQHFLLNPFSIKAYRKGNKKKNGQKLAHSF